MAGWAAIAGTHDFIAAGEENARAVAEALSAHGFPLVTAHAEHARRWRVTALDEGPYPVTSDGHRQFAAVGGDASRIARRLRAYRQGGSQFDPAMIPLHTREVPITLARPGSRPPIPDLAEISVPPAAELAIEPDPTVRIAPDLSDLDDIDWPGLEHAFGSAWDVADFIRALARGEQVLTEFFYDSLIHQETCYSATAPAMRLIIRVIPSLPAADRLKALLAVLHGVDRWGASLIDDADIAFAQGRLPQAAAWTQDVRLAAETGLPGLLAQWDDEPPAHQYVLTCLSALFPDTGHQVPAGYRGTQQGACLDLARALRARDDESAFQIAQGVASWVEHVDPEWFEVPGVPVAVTAGRVLAAAVESTTLYPA